MCGEQTCFAQRAKMNKNKVVLGKPGASSCAGAVSVRFQLLTPPRCCAHCVPAFVCSAVGRAPWSSSIHTPGPKPCSAPTARRPPPPGGSAQASPPPSTCAVMAVPAELVSPQALPCAALRHQEDWAACFSVLFTAGGPSAEGGLEYQQWELPHTLSPPPRLGAAGDNVENITCDGRRVSTQQ